MLGGKEVVHMAMWDSGDSGDTDSGDTMDSGDTILNSLWFSALGRASAGGGGGVARAAGGAQAIGPQEMPRAGPKLDHRLLPLATPERPAAPGGHR